MDGYTGLFRLVDAAVLTGWFLPHRITHRRPHSPRATAYRPPPPFSHACAHYASTFYLPLYLPAHRALRAHARLFRAPLRALCPTGVLSRYAYLQRRTADR